MLPRQRTSKSLRVRSRSTHRSRSQSEPFRHSTVGGHQSPFSECPHHSCALSVKEHSPPRPNRPVEAKVAGNRRQDGVPTPRRYGKSFAVPCPALMEEVSPWLDVFTPNEIARAAAVDVRDVRALLANGRWPTIDGSFVAAAHAVEVVRALRSGIGRSRGRTGLVPARAGAASGSWCAAGWICAGPCGDSRRLCAPYRGRTSRPEVAAVRHLQSGVPGDARTGRRGRGRRSEAARAAAACRASGREPDAKPGRHPARRPRPQDRAAARASAGSHARGRSR